MKIERAKLTERCYALKGRLATSRTVLMERRGCALELIDEDGVSGCGESLPLPLSGTEDLDATRAALRAASAGLPGREGDLGELLDWVDAQHGGTPAARCAIDTALHDLEAQRGGEPVASLLADHPSRSVEVNAVLGSNDAGGSTRDAAASVSRGYRTLKLKVGALPLEADATRLAGVRDAVPQEIGIRVDANGSWSVEAALSALERLSDFDLELIEQPVEALDLEGLRRVSERSPSPVAADEALASEEGRRALVAGKLAPVAILKPMVLGGLRASAQLARAASGVGVRCVVTTTFEGPVGLAAALHLAAAVGDSSLAHGLAASDTLVADFPDELVPVAGRLRRSLRPGLLGGLSR